MKKLNVFKKSFTTNRIRNSFLPLGKFYKTNLIFLYFFFEIFRKI